MPEDMKTGVQSVSEAVVEVTRNVAAVSLTLPTFWSQNPDAWFAKVEAQFRSAKVTLEETRYYKVLAVLPESAAIRVRDISQKTQYESGDYAKLKQKLIRSNQPSTLERMDRLCELKNVNHKKPSELLLDIEIIFHSAVADQVFPTNEFMKKYWWLRALPTTIQQNLLPVADNCTIDNLTMIADQMFAANPPVEHVSEIHVDSDQGSGREGMTPSDFPFDTHHDELNVAAVSHRSTSRNLRPQEKDNLLLCKYHVRFGERAKHCVVACSRYGSQPKN